MHRIDTSTAQKDKFGAGKNGFTAGNPQTGVPATEVSAEILDAMQEELCNVIAMAGMQLNKGDNNQLTNAILAIAIGAYPVGAPIPWPQSTPPAGFLMMQGQSFSATSYPKLALAYPSQVLPDLRGEFIRGWDNGRGIDSNRSLLSAQKGSVVSIDQNISDTAVSGAIGTTQSNTGLDSLTGTDISGVSTAAFTAATPAVAAPTNSSAGVVRPRNIAFNYIVRAA